MTAKNPTILEEPRAQYILGYCYYNLVDVEPEAASRSEQAFLAALEKNPDDDYAKLYLGHLAFDLSQFELALRWFDSIPNQAFSAHGQPWRDLKRQELRICCLVRLGRNESITSEFESYLTLATQCDELDVYSVYELPILLATLAESSEDAV